MDPDALRWEPHFPRGDSTIWYLLFGTDQLARVTRRVDGAGWVSEVGRYRRDWKARPAVNAPTRAAAIRWAERWTRANLARIPELELPPLVATHCGTKTTAPEAYR